MGKYIYPATDEAVAKPEPIKVTEKDQEGQPVEWEYLPVDRRVDWYHRYCMAHDIMPCIDTEETGRKDEPVGGYSERFKASVYFNGVLVARGHGSELSVNQLNPKIRIFETAETFAIGRALKHAGFSLPKEKPDEEPGNFADAPRPVQQAQLPFDGPTGPVPMDPDEQEARRPDPPATMQEAFALKVPFGQYKGRMLGEVNATDRNFLLWLAGIITSNSPFTSQRDYPRMMAAVNMVLNA